MNIRDPAHLRSQHASLPKELATGMDAEAASGPSHEQLARMAAAIGVVAPVPPPAAVAPAPSGGAGIWIGGGAVIATVIVGVGAWWMTREAPASHVERPPAQIEEPTAPVIEPPIVHEQVHEAPEPEPAPVRVRRDPAPVVQQEPPTPEVDEAE